jgi:hypothetical protein
VKAAKIGTYQLRFAGKEHAGEWTGWPLLQETSCALSVWNAVDPNPSVAYVGPAPNGSAEFEVVALHGHPAEEDIEYQATVEDDGVSFVNVTPGVIKQLSQSGGVAVAIWRSAAKGPKGERSRFYMNIKTTSPKDEAYWKDLAKKIQVGAASTNAQ